MQYLRSVIFVVLCAASVLPFALWVLLAAPFPHRFRYAAVRGWVDVALWLLRVLCRLDYEVVGAEHIPQQNSVVYLKHSSAFETLVEVQVFPPQTWVLKRELKWIPIFGWALALVKPIAINRGARGSAVRQVLTQGRERIADGLWVMIFPEGTRMAPGQTRRYGLSGALLAARTGREVVPVAHNAADFWGRRTLLKRPGTMRFVIGPPIAARDRTPAEINALAQTWIEATMREISAGYQSPTAP